ncbi:MAG: RluA family pseudouridine synthase [Parcubacteria group bacterium]|nr:RluA family pseudouridine synthase [Parcubacteria group bacterium]MCR4342894.1 RluA family pseudouridine synthase [Patescibacteria group bacterium]
MLEPKIIYEDKDQLVINKPAGVLMHKALQTKPGTFCLADWLIKKYPKIKKVGDDPVLRPGIVHRLDKETSGALVIAKTQPAFEFLKKQFQEREVRKNYVALVCGNIKKEEGMIDLPIGKSKKDIRKFVAGSRARGVLRDAVTEYEVIKRFENYTLVNVYPKTGRTHQIRVHMKAIGYPVACDALYAHKGAKCPPGLTRHFLHAKSLEFELYCGGKIKIEADLPYDLKETLAKLKDL